MNPDLAKTTLRNLIEEDSEGRTEKDIYPNSEVKVLCSKSGYYSDLSVGVFVEAQKFIKEYPGVFGPPPRMRNMSNDFTYNVPVDSNLHYQMEKYLGEEIGRVFNGDIEHDPLLKPVFNMLTNLPYELSGSQDPLEYFFSFELEVYPILDRALDASLEDFARAFMPLKQFYEEEVLTGDFLTRFMSDFYKPKKTEVSKLIIREMNQENVGTEE